MRFKSLSISPTGCRPIHSMILIAAAGTLEHKGPYLKTWVLLLLRIKACRCEVQGHPDARPSWKTVARLTWSRMLHLWRPLSSHEHMSALPARSQMPSPALTPQGSKKHMQASQRSDSSMSGVPLKSDWQLRALHAETGSSSRRPSFEGENLLNWACVRSKVPQHCQWPVE